MFPTKLDVNMIIFMPRKIHKQLLKNLSRNAKRAHFKVLHPKSRRTLISKLWNMQTNWVYTFWHLGKNEYYFLFRVHFFHQPGKPLSFLLRSENRLEAPIDCQMIIGNFHKIFYWKIYHKLFRITNIQNCFLFCAHS